MNRQECFKNFQKIITEIPELGLFGEPVLHTPADTVSLKEASSIVPQLEQALLKYRQLAGLGRGIAAPQIGISKQVFITYINDTVEAYLNPEITTYSQETNCYREPCMSSSIMWSDVERPKEIRLSWMDSNGHQHEEQFDGFMARLLQHEYDHLQGCVCLDKAIPGTISFVDSDPGGEKLRDS
jgi:peptide deformylase